MAVVALAIALIVRVWVLKADEGKSVAPASVNGTASQILDTWRLVAYQGKHVPYRVFLPDYWVELPRPPDENADRAFAGPRGLVLSLYRFDDLDSFRAGLAKTVPVTDASQGQGERFLELMISSPLVNGVRLIPNAFVCLFGSTRVAMTLRAPVDAPFGIINGAIFEVGQFAVGYSKAAYGNPDRPDVFNVQPRTSSVLLTQLGKWDDIERASGAVLTAPRTVGKDAYKARMSFYFDWSVGNKLNVEAALFQRIMGKPSHTQTMQMGREVWTEWSYDCADGTIQLVADARLLANGGKLQATVNDY